MKIWRGISAHPTTSTPGVRRDGRKIGIRLSKILELADLVQVVVSATHPDSNFMAIEAVIERRQPRSCMAFVYLRASDYSICKTEGSRREESQICFSASIKVAYLTGYIPVTGKYRIVG